VQRDLMETTVRKVGICEDRRRDPRLPCLHTVALRMTRSRTPRSVTNASPLAKRPD
jgi:hypothetical protein